MKYIKDYQRFKDFRKNEKNESFHYYTIGKKSNYSLLDSILISEKYSSLSNFDISDKKRLDRIIIDSMYESFNNESLIFEENTFLQRFNKGINKLWSSTKQIWNTGIKIFGEVYNSFSDFIKNIGKIIGDFFKKIGEVFKALWGLVKTSSVTLFKGMMSYAVGNIKGSSVNTFVEIVTNEDSTKEISELSNDLKGVKNKFQSGKIGDQSDSLKSKLEDEAEEYDGVDNLDEVGKLANESFEIYSKSNFKKVYFCLKGYLIEGNSLQGLVLEADEQEYKEGDLVKYRNSKGEELEKEIIRIDGDNYFFKDKEGNEFSKKKTDIVGKSENKKITGKMGVMGFFIEAIKLILKPMDYIVNMALKLGSNGILMVISAISRGGWKNAYKYTSVGGTIIQVKDIFEGVGEEKEEEEGVIAPEGAEDSVDAAKEVKKSKKLDSILGDVSKVIAPILGSLLLKYLEAQFGPIVTILKYVLMGYSVLRLVKLLCEKNVIKGKVCSLASIDL